MRIDKMNGAMIFDQEEMDKLIEEFNKDKVFPDYVEAGILKVLTDSNTNSSEELKVKLSGDYLKNIAEKINSLYDKRSLINYDGYHEAYLAYYLPVNFFKIWKPLFDLLLKNKLKSKIRVFDVGTGTGSVPLGILELYKILAIDYPEIDFGVSFVLIDEDNEFLENSKRMLSHVLKYMPPNLEVTFEGIIQHKISSEFSLDKIEFEEVNPYDFDLITLSNFINANQGWKLDDVYKLIGSFKENLDENGSIIIIENTEKENYIELKHLRNELINNRLYNMYSPCNGIWEEKKNYSCTCAGMVRSFWGLPELYKFLHNYGMDQGKRFYIPFNYVVLRKDGATKYPVEPDKGKYTSLKDLEPDTQANVVALIRTIFYDKYEGCVRVYLCDGSCSFESLDGIWLELDYDYHQNHRLISAERVILDNVQVTQIGCNIILELIPKSLVKIEY